mgnify:CR=1 FL=1
MEFGTFKIPETTLNINSFVNSNGDGGADYGAVIGVNIPLGGKSRKSINRALDIQVQADALAFERSYASVCANLDSESYTVANTSGNLNLLKSCRTDIVKRNVVTPPPIVTPPVVVPPPVVVNSEIDELKKQNAELRLLIAQLAEKLDNNNKPVPGGY